MSWKTIHYPVEPTRTAEFGRYLHVCHCLHCVIFALGYQETKRRQELDTWFITKSMHSFMLRAVQCSLIRQDRLSEILCSPSRHYLLCKQRVASCAVCQLKGRKGNWWVCNCWKVRGQGVYWWESSCALGLTGNTGCTMPSITHAAWGPRHLCN